MKSTSLAGLQIEKIMVGLHKLETAGINPEQWLAMLDADHAAMLHLKKAWPGTKLAEASQGTGIVYDAKAVCKILGLPCKCEEEAPTAADGEVVVWYGGWTLQELVSTGEVVSHLSREREAWQAPAGYYHTLIPVPKSNQMTHDERISLLARLYAALKELPTPVGATALAAHLRATDKDLLKGNFCCCAEALPDGSRTGLCVRDGRVSVSDFWDDDRYDGVFLGAARKSEL